MKILAETGGRITVLDHEAFDDESKLQKLLEQYPELVLAGTSDDEERSIWTIGYEVGVPSGSIDLLLLDSTGRLWVVETKLAKNPEIRKHVVGQVLAYASDVATWSREDLEHVADGYLASREEGPDTLQGLLAETMDAGQVDDLLDRAVGRLSRGDLTALIVVDELNTVLRRLVEFVNTSAQFTLLALKVETVSHAGSRLFIPTVVGVTTPGGTTHRDDLETFEDLLEAAPERTKELAGRLDALAEKHGWATKTGKKSRNYHRPDGGFLFRFYPKWSSIMFDLSQLRSQGDHETADRIQALASDMEGRPQGPKEPGVGAERLLDHWETFETELLPLLTEAAKE